jgi:hypothetical protein
MPAAWIAGICMRPTIGSNAGSWANFVGNLTVSMQSFMSFLQRIADIYGTEQFDDHVHKPL